MKKLLFMASIIITLTGCVTGEIFSNLTPGMSKDEVIKTIGKPDGYSKQGNYETFKYTNRLMSGWAWNRADYYAKFENNILVDYGTAKIREHASPLQSFEIYKTNNN